MITVQKVETFRWLTFVDRVGVTIKNNEVQEPGLMYIDPQNVLESFETDWKRYSTTSFTPQFKFEHDPKSGLEKQVCTGPVSASSFTTLDKQDVLQAVLAAFC